MIYRHCLRNRMGRWTLLFLVLCPFLGVTMSHEPVVDDRIYTFAMGDSWLPYEFISDDGAPMGFLYDVVREVCAKAHKQCSMITYIDYNMCWNNDKMQGDGLNGRFWDVCVGYPPTKNRQLAHGFIGAIGKEPKLALFVRTNSAIRLPQHVDQSRSKIGFRRGFYYSGACLERLMGWKIESKVAIRGVPALIQQLKNGEINLAFMEEADGIKAGFRKVGDTLSCADAGPSMMVRKDAVNDFKWFMPAFKEVIASGYYHWICKIAKKAYGGDPNCFE